jgi:hypothetical protein
LGLKVLGNFVRLPGLTLKSERASYKKMKLLAWRHFSIKIMWLKVNCDGRSLRTYHVYVTLLVIVECVIVAACRFGDNELEPTREHEKGLDGQWLAKRA